MKASTIGRQTIRSPGMGLMGSLKSYLARSRAERQLHQLDDRLLADIGLSRADITRSVWGR